MICTVDMGAGSTLACRLPVAIMFVDVEQNEETTDLEDASLRASGRCFHSLGPFCSL